MMILFYSSTLLIHYAKIILCYSIPLFSRLYKPFYSDIMILFYSFSFLIYYTKVALSTSVTLISRLYI